MEQISIKRTSQYLDYFIDPNFQGVNILFVLSFEDSAQGTSHKQCFLSTTKIKDYNVVIDGQNFFDLPVKNDLRTYDNMRKLATGQRDDYTTGCLLDQNYIKEYYKMKAIDLSKQQALDADLEAIEQQCNNFTGNLTSEGNSDIQMFFIIEEAKETKLDFSNGTVKCCEFIFH